MLGDEHRASQAREAFRHRVFIEIAGVFSFKFAWLQHGPQPHAVCSDGCQPRKSRSDLFWRFGRWGHGLNWNGTIRPRCEAKPEHGLPRDEQWLLWAHQRSGFRDRRRWLKKQDRASESI